MVGYVFEKILDYNSYVIANGKEKHEITLEFVGINKPKVGDKLLIHVELLNKYSALYTQPYAFELVDEDPKHVTMLNDREYIVISLGDKLYTLKRIYG